MGLFYKISIIIFFVSLLISNAYSWGWFAHEYMCPSGLDCTSTDTQEFQNKYPFTSHSESWHLCALNKTDCGARLAANYYLKKYYSESVKNKDYLEIAAHLIQDSFCPAHWQKGFENLEEAVDSYIESNATNWEVTYDYNGGRLVINKEYLDSVKEYVVRFVNKEPDSSSLFYDWMYLTWMSLIKGLPATLFIFTCIVILIIHFVLEARRKAGLKKKK